MIYACVLEKESNLIDRKAREIGRQQLTCLGNRHHLERWGALFWLGHISCSSWSDGGASAWHF